MNKIVSGIYEIFNNKNKKSYIGSSQDIYKRFSNHKSDLRNNKHKNNNIQNDFNEFGEESFEFRIVFPTFDLHKLETLEAYYIGIYNSFENGYNSTLTTKQKRNDPRYILISNINSYEYSDIYDIARNKYGLDVENFCKMAITRFIKRNDLFENLANKISNKLIEGGK